MTKDEALKLALEALTYIYTETTADEDELIDQAITAIKEALAQEQEPLAWISTGPASMIHWTSDKPAYGDDWVPLYTTPPQRMAKRIEDLEAMLERQTARIVDLQTHIENLEGEDR